MFVGIFFLSLINRLFVCVCDSDLQCLQQIKSQYFENQKNQKQKQHLREIPIDNIFSRYSRSAQVVHVETINGFCFIISFFLSLFQFFTFLSSNRTIIEFMKSMKIYDFYTLTQLLSAAAVCCRCCVA